MNKLFVWDFDDTLVHDHGTVRLIKTDGTRVNLTQQEYYDYRPKKGETIDLSDFDSIHNPTLNKKNLSKLKQHHDNSCILTARSHEGIVVEFMKTLGINVPVHAIGLHDPKKDCVLINARRKQNWIRQAIKFKKLDYVEFHDDNHFNIECANELRKEFPHVKIVTHLVKK